MEAENQKRDLLLWVREVEMGAQPKLELESRARQKPWFGIQEEHLGLKRSSLDGQRSRLRWSQADIRMTVDEDRVDLRGWRELSTSQFLSHLNRTRLYFIT